MLVLDMIYWDCIVKKGKKKSTGTLRHISHALDPLGFRAWQISSFKHDSIESCSNTAKKY